jgi:hypothetical protein
VSSWCRPTSAGRRMEGSAAVGGSKLGLYRIVLPVPAPVPVAPPTPGMPAAAASAALSGLVEFPPVVGTITTVCPLESRFANRCAPSVVPAMMVRSRITCASNTGSPPLCTSIPWSGCVPRCKPVAVTVMAKVRIGGASPMRTVGKNCRQPHDYRAPVGTLIPDPDCGCAAGKHIERSFDDHVRRANASSLAGNVSRRYIAYQNRGDSRRQYWAADVGNGRRAWCHHRTNVHVSHSRCRRHEDQFLSVCVPENRAQYNIRNPIRGFA